MRGVGVTRRAADWISDCEHGVVWMEECLAGDIKWWDISVICTTTIITSATEGGWSLCFYPCRSVCFFIRLLRKYLKKLWTELDEILRSAWVCDKDEMIRLWWRSESRSRPEIFWSDSTPLSEGHIAGYLKKLWTDSDETWWVSWFGGRNKLIKFWFRSKSRSSLFVGYKT